jgi:hypothetical protein
VAVIPVPADDDDDDAGALPPPHPPPAVAPVDDAESLVFGMR